MLTNYSSQTTNYGGQLIFPSVSGFPQVTIPLYVTETDIPIRQPKITEISTIPVVDEAQQYDGVTQAIFFGAAEPLGTNLGGFLLTPISATTDGITGGKVWQLNPTVDGSDTGASLGLIGVSYGDLIWAYLEGSISQSSLSIYVRTDPSFYVDPFGNSYTNPIIQSFTCTQTVALSKQTFTMTLKLEV